MYGVIKLPFRMEKIIMVCVPKMVHAHFMGMIMICKSNKNLDTVKLANKFTSPIGWWKQVTSPIRVYACKQVYKSNRVVRTSLQVQYGKSVVLVLHDLDRLVKDRLDTVSKLQIL
jgi:hypothetical protein